MFLNEEIYYEELAHRVLEAERSQDLHLASWRQRRASDVSSSLSPSAKAGQDLYPSWKTDRE